jgi:hypothetical protein
VQRDKISQKKQQLSTYSKNPKNTKEITVKSCSKKEHEGHELARDIQMEHRRRMIRSGVTDGGICEARRWTRVAETSKSGFEKTISVITIKTGDERDGGLSM